MNKLGSQGWQPLVVILRQAIFERDVPSFYVAGFHQALANCSDPKSIGFRRPGAEKSYHRHHRLLCLCCERPDGRAADQCDELAPPHGRSRNQEAAV
jgi:hypothetical protein